MIQLCMFSGHEGRWRPDQKLYFTMFGGCALTRPTVARQILADREWQADPRRSPQRTFFLTVFGGVVIRSPTLSEEFIDLRQILDSGALSLTDYERAIAVLGRSESSIYPLTVFGGFVECQLPSENVEVDSLALQRHVGNIPDSAGRVLQLGIGQRDAERRATVHRAVLATA